MVKLYKTLKALRRDRADRGATAAEYALLVALIAVVVAAAVALFGNAITDRFQNACQTVAVNQAECTPADAPQ